MVIFDNKYLNSLVTDSGYEVSISRFWLKLGYESKWKDWSEELKTREDEVIKTLEQESVVLELCIMVKDQEIKNNLGYVIMFAKSIEQAYKIVQSNPHQIDLEHREARIDCFERGEDIGSTHIFDHEEYEILFWFDRRKMGSTLKSI